MKEYEYKSNLTSISKTKQKINYFYYIKQIFIGILFMLFLYAFVWIGFFIDVIFNNQ